MLLADGGNEELMIWGAHGTYHYLFRGDHNEEIDAKNMQRHLWLDCSRIFLWNYVVSTPVSPGPDFHVACR